jgi:hypothetical protein
MVLSTLHVLHPLPLNFHLRNHCCPTNVLKQEDEATLTRYYIESGSGISEAFVEAI